MQFCVQEFSADIEFHEIQRQGGKQGVLLFQDQEVIPVQAQDPVEVNVLLYFVALLVSAGYPSLFALFLFRT